MTAQVDGALPPGDANFRCVDCPTVSADEGEIGLKEIPGNSRSSSYEASNAIRAVTFPAEAGLQERDAYGR